MTAYVPTDHPEPKGWERGVDVTIENQDKQYHAYGPPPRNYSVVRKNYRAGEENTFQPLLYERLSIW